MRVLILDGSWPADPVATHLVDLLQAQAQLRGWSVTYWLLRDQKIGHCAGDFFCWVKTPGVCMTNDVNRQIAAAMIQSDLVVYLSPVTFGGYSSALKRVVDHQIQNISPFFTRINAEIHHEPRYERYPAILSIGWMPNPDPASVAVFQHLAHRNAFNMYAPTTVSGVLATNQDPADRAAQVTQWLDMIERGTSTPMPDLPNERIAPARPTPIKRALLLVGSPRTTQSTSGALGEYLLAQLTGRGVAVEQYQIYTQLNSPARVAALLPRLDQTDLIILAFPLYIDTLPAPVIAVLEQIAANRQGRTGDQRMLAIANCGFPEAHHNANALALCEIFARTVGFSWAGSLGLGQGAGMINGQALDRLGWHITPIRQALGTAAEGLVTMGTIPLAAANLMSRPTIPSWLYTLVAGLSWGGMAKRYQAERDLRRRPYAE